MDSVESKDESGRGGTEEREETTREEEQGEASEPDAPTSEEENEGMSTILDANPVTGVQPDASDG